MKNRRFLNAALIAIVCIAAPLAAAEESHEPLGGLLIRECYTPANSLLRQADTLREKGDYARALAAYQEVLREYPRSLFPLSEETFEGRKGVTYVNAAEYVEERLGSMPEEARAEYARLYEDRARSFLDRWSSPDRRDPLLKAATTYPIAPSGLRALGLLARFDLQDGRWAAAATRFRALLQRDRFHWEKRRPEIVSLALALFREGRQDSLERLADDVANRIDGEAGKALAARVRRFAENVPPRREESAWSPRFGVNDAGTGVTDTPVRDIPAAWQIPLFMLPGGSSSHDGLNAFQSREGAIVGVALKRRWRPYFPSLVSDRVYLHNGIDFGCLDLIRDNKSMENAVWRWTSVYGRAASSGDAPVGDTNFEPNRIFTTTLDGERLYALLEIPAEAHMMQSTTYHNYEVIPPIPRRRLLAIQTRTGRIIWEAGAKERPVTLLDKLSFSTEPLVRDGKLYLAGAIFDGIPTAYVACLDATRGTPIWIHRIATGSQELNMFGRPVREYCGSAIYARGDSIYFCTNLGAVACLGAQDGIKRWVFRYPSNPRPASMNFHTLKTPRAWAPNPIVAAPDRIVVAPTDSDNLYALDPDAGRLLWSKVGRPRWARFQRSPGGIEHAYVAGSWDGKVFLHGKTVEALHIRSGTTAWKRTFSTSSEEPAGRGALAGGLLYVPSTHALYIFDAKSGRAVARHEWERPAREAGNLIVAGGYLLSVSQTHLNCYYDLDRLLERIIKQARDASADTAATLRAAWVCLRNGRLDDALGFFRRAGMTAGAASEYSDEVRRGLYRVFDALGDAAWKKQDYETALRHFERALQDAPSREETLATSLKVLEYHKRRNDTAKVEAMYRAFAADHGDFEYAFEGAPLPVDLWARFSLARYLADGGMHGRAVSEYQAIISQGLTTPFRLGRRQGAARELAAAEISALLERIGREPYGPFEKQAEALFEKGRADKDADALSRCLERYPNATVCGAALLELGAQTLAKGDLDGAERHFKRLLRDFPGSEQRVEALALLGLTLERRQSFGRAKRVFLRLQAQFPKTRIRPEGAPIVAGQWVAQRLERPEYRDIDVSDSRSDLHYKGSRKLWSTALERPPELIDIAGPRPVEMAPFALVRLGEDLRAISTENGQLLWATRDPGDLPQQAGFCGKVLVVCGSYRVRGLDPATGRVIWMRSFSSGGIIRGMRVRDTIAAFMINGIDGRTLHLWTVVMDGQTGTDLFPPRSLEQWGGRSVPVLGEEVMVTYIREGTARIFAFDLVVGKRLFSHMIKGMLYGTPVLFERARRVIYATRPGLVALDLSGDQVWALNLGAIDRDSLVKVGDRLMVTRSGEDGLREAVCVDIDTGDVAWRSKTGLHSILQRDVTSQGVFLLGRHGLEARLRSIEAETGKTQWAALLSARPGPFVSMLLGTSVGVAKVGWPRGVRADGEFRVFSLENGRLVATLEYADSSAAPNFTVVDGTLVYAEGSKLVGWGKGD